MGLEGVLPFRASGISDLKLTIQTQHDIYYHTLLELWKIFQLWPCKWGSKFTIPMEYWPMKATKWSEWLEVLHSWQVKLPIDSFREAIFCTTPCVLNMSWMCLELHLSTSVLNANPMELDTIIILQTNFNNCASNLILFQD